MANTKLKISFKHPKDARDNRGTLKIYGGDYRRLFNRINRDSIFSEIYEDDLFLYDNYMILILSEVLDSSEIAWIESNLKNTKVIE